MYERFMKKYGRAIDSESERETLYGLYKARNIMLICAFLSWCLLIISALFFIDTDDQENLAAFVLVFALLIVVLALLIILAVFAIKFQVMYSKILTRAPQEGETPEVISYRKKVVASEKRAKKSNIVGKIFLAIGGVVLIATSLYDSVKYPDSDDMSAVFWFGTVFFAICVAVFMFGMIISKSKAYKH